MNNLLHRLKTTAYFLFLSLFNTGYFFVQGNLSPENNQEAEETSYLFEKLDTPHKFLRVAGKLYMSSFEEALTEKKQIRTEEERLKELKRKEYEVDRPALTEREQAEVLFGYVITPENSNFLAFFKELNNASPADLRAVSAENVKLLAGTVSKPQNSLVNQIAGKDCSPLGRSMLAIVVMKPLGDIPALLRRQDLIKTLVNHQKERAIMKEAFTHVKKVLPSLLSLYKPDSDPLLSSAYQKMLGKIYNVPSGNFSNKLLRVEFGRRFSLDYVLLMTTLTLVGFLLAHFYIGRALYQGNDLVWGVFKFALNNFRESDFQDQLGVLFMLSYAYGAVAILVYQSVTQYKMYRTTSDYISSRLADFQTIFEAAALIDKVVSSNPELEKRLGGYLIYTRKVLRMQHENPAYNQLTYAMLTNNFKQYSLFFNSPGRLLDTMGRLIENYRLVNGILLELGRVEAFLAVAGQMSRNGEYSNKYSYARYKKGNKPYIELDGIWNPIVGRGIAKPNTVKIDGAQQSIYCITGPNACGKSVLNGGVNGALILAQTLGIAPTNSVCMITPFGAFFAFKEPKDDPNRKKSLFAGEVEAVETLLTILKDAEENGYTVYISCDEFLGSTNFGEKLALQRAIVGEIVGSYPNAMTIISTHNFPLINQLVKDPRAQVVQVMIERYSDGSYEPLYIVKPGKSNEKVGIDLFLKEIRKNGKVKAIGEKIAKNARNNFEKIKRQMERIK